MLSHFIQLSSSISWELFKYRRLILPLILLAVLILSLGSSALPVFAENGGGSGVCVGCP